LPKLGKNYHFNFYGGEPLLYFDLIRKTIPFLNEKNKLFKKKVNYSLTTNGSLITEEIIQFFSKHKFSVELSFDGLAQDVLRTKGSFKKTVSIIEELLNYPDIDLEINSVFTPTTVDYISDSIKFIMDLGVLNIHFSLSMIKPWNQASLQKLENEMMKLVKILVDRYKRKRDIPITNFREESGKGIFYCAAGRDRLAITPDEKIWGCFLFPDYFKGKENSPEFQKFYFGSLDDFIENYKSIYPRILSNYARLSMDNFSASCMGCFLCPELENCAVCPINASLSGNSLGEIPSYLCKIQKIKIKEKEKFRREIQKI
jgi:sulfatase maturation enzyme AslB (radical SAM superfamily)